MHVTRTIFTVFAFKVTPRVILLTWFCKLLTRVATLSGGYVPQVPQWHDASAWVCHLCCSAICTGSTFQSAITAVATVYIFLFSISGARGFVLVSQKKIIMSIQRCPGGGIGMVQNIVQGEVHATDNCAPISGP